MKFAMCLYENMTALDFIGPYQVFSSWPGAETITVAKIAGPVRDDGGHPLFNADLGFTDITESDVLFVPGSSNNAHVLGDSETLDWVRAIDATTTYTTSVCTGSLVLAAAGLLEGRRATSHWAALEMLETLGAIPVPDQRVVTDGKYVTGAGVAAGIDMALTFAGEVIGAEAARAIQLMIEYDPSPPFDSGHPRSTPDEIVALALQGLGARARQVTE